MIKKEEENKCYNSNIAENMVYIYHIFIVYFWVFHVSIYRNLHLIFILLLLKQTFEIIINNKKEKILQQKLLNKISFYSYIINFTKQMKQIYLVYRFRRKKNENV